jgi:hypothetical protein
LFGSSDRCDVNEPVRAGWISAELNAIDFLQMNREYDPIELTILVAITAEEK